MEEYVDLSEVAVRRAAEYKDKRPVDLIIWPETMFRTGLTTFAPGYELPSTTGVTVQQVESYGPSDLAALARRLNTALLVGIDRVHYSASSEKAGAMPEYDAYNSSVLVNAMGKIIGTYDKVHRVMFGEYIPFADRIPMLYRLTPLTGGIQAGAGPVALELDGDCYAPNICYETVIPHVIRRQVARLTKQGNRPDVLVNLTNDAWYWGSSELDMHLACGVFRAVECRTPLVVAANGGLSASVDSCGRIVQQSPRQNIDVILADVQLDPRTSLYVARGDWFSGICLAACIGLAIVGLASRRAICAIK
jgi:apolipoprotein N-acyltransferase